MKTKHLLRNAAASCAIFAMLLPAPLRAESAAETDVLLAPAEMARVEAAIDRGLEYLLRQQQDDGSWPCWVGSNNGVNALCLLAFLGRGHVPGRGPYRAVVERSMAQLLKTQNEQGLYVSAKPSHGPMYEHALATLALVEAYGAVPSPSLRTSVQKAIDLIVKAQSPVGGWRYQPHPGDADLSVTVMQVMALRSAVNARLTVPLETIEKALLYVRSCAAPQGGFSYQPGRAPSPAQSAAGALSMAMLGGFEDPSVARGLDYLMKADFQTKSPYFYYTSYYAMQANFQAGGTHWANWHPKARDLLLDNQQEDGSWQGYAEQAYNGAALCYSTAFACMTLEVYMHYLPAYQR